MRLSWLTQHYLQRCPAAANHVAPGRAHLQDERVVSSSNALAVNPTIQLVNISGNSVSAGKGFPVTRKINGPSLHCFPVTFLN